MPIYNFKCTECSFAEEIDIKISEYLLLQNDKVDSDSCSSSCLYKDRRSFSSIGVDTEMDYCEVIENIREEAREIVKKVNNGDMNTIENICG